MTEALLYPPPPRSDIVERLHGVAVSDPFRPLENAADPETAQWVEAQNALTRRCLDGPLREELVRRLQQLHRYPRSSIPAVRGGRLFFTHNTGTANQAALCVLDGPGQSRCLVLVDPNVLDSDGTTAITAFAPDDEGGRVVYALSRHGSDQQELRVVDVETGRDLPDSVRWVKFAAIAWLRNGFFYTRFPTPGSVPPEQAQYFCQVWFHSLGSPQEADRLVYHRPDAPAVVFDVDVTSDGTYLVLTSRPGASDKAEVHVVDVGEPDHLERPPRPLVTGFTDAWHFINGRAGRLYFRTDVEAPRGRIVCLDLGDPALKPQVVVGESEDTIVDAAIGGGRLIVHSLHNASSRLELSSLDAGDRRDIKLPGIGTVVGIGSQWSDERAYVLFTSFTMPPQIYRISTTGDTEDTENQSLQVSSSVSSVSSVVESSDSTTEGTESTESQSLQALTSVSSVSSVVESSDYITEQVWYPSKDGTQVSMFLVRKRGRTPFPEMASEKGYGPFSDAVLLTGYGGFNISLTPAFRPSDFLWLDAGGVIAVPHLRGGGEYGEAWHLAGMREGKQNVFDDFIAAAEWLRARGHASAGRIAIEGASNGGLLVGAVMLQRPDLFGAVVCRVPVADMLRYHLFTVGRFWIPEYGSADDPGDFAYLKRYSPYHNVADRTPYPPTLVMTADTDDRVDPGMAKKFAARLQEAVTGGEGGPILLRVETRAGHGAGKPIGKQIEEHADLYTFLFQYLAASRASEQQRR